MAQQSRNLRFKALILLASLVLIGAGFWYGLNTEKHEDTLSTALTQIDAQPHLRNKFSEAHRLISKYGSDAVFERLKTCSLNSESEQILLIEVGRSGDRRFAAMLQRLANSESPLSRFADAALRGINMEK